jgi:hypothetical protein
MKNIQYTVMLIVFITLLAGCDPIIYYEYHVNNNSGKEFQIGFNSGFLDSGINQQDSGYHYATF